MSHTIQILYPIWIGIAFNLAMTAANFAIDYYSPLGRWYFERNGGVKMMVGAWAFFISWSVFNGMTH